MTIFRLERGKSLSAATPAYLPPLTCSYRSVRFSLQLDSSRFGKSKARHWSNSLKIVLVALYDLRSFGVRILHTLLRQRGFAVTSVFFNEAMTCGPYRDKDVDLLAQTILAERPDLIGVAVRSPLFVLFEKLAARLRQHTDALILAGGYHPTCCPEECLTVADLVCVGEGEEALVELCERLARGDSIEQIPNIWLRKNGRIIANPVRPLIEDLDSVPFPDYTNTDKRHVVHGKVVAEGIRPQSVRRFNVLTGRGCVYNCSYCFNHVMQKIYRAGGKFRRRRSPANVIAELKKLHEMFPNLESIFFSDRIFLHDEDWILEFCDLYAREVGIPFGCFGHLSTMTEAMLARAKGAGLNELAVGIQSGSETVLRDMYNRRTSRKDIIDCAKMIERVGLVPLYDMITNNPLETDETRRETLELLFDLPRPYHLRLFSMRFFPATALTNRFLAEGLIGEHELESHREVAFGNWVYSLDARKGKPDRDIFWDAVYYMWQIGFPRTIVEAVANSTSLRRTPRLLAEPLRWCVKRPGNLKKEAKKIGGYLRRGRLRPLWDDYFAVSHGP